MYKTAESVSPMHPDKICDRISDAILDACLEQDPMSRVAIETFGCHGVINVGGELTTKAFVNIREIVNKIVPNYGIQVNIVSQSPEISSGVDSGGAGDQGIMVGYACRDNEDMIPQELYLARSLCKYIYVKWPFDGKTQITLDGQKVIAIVVSFQNAPKDVLRKIIKDWIFEKKAEIDEKKLIIYANPAGDWNQGGFEADTGLTGRKLAVDNYGPQIPIGGGSFSGKDATKVDRSGAYKARQLAVRFLKSNKYADECMVKIAYAIGVAEPVMVTVGYKIADQWVEEYITDKNILDELEPTKIIYDLYLRKPIYQETAEWGHFGEGFIWDK